MNFASMIMENAVKRPSHVALVGPSVRFAEKEISLSFADFSALCAQYSRGLHKSGFRAGDRLTLLFPPCIELYALITACFMTGIVPVYIDTDMARSKVLAAISQSESQGVISAGDFLIRWPWIGTLWFKKLFAVDNFGFGMRRITDLMSDELGGMNEVTIPDDEAALISFRSGWGDLPRGDILTHPTLMSQNATLRKNFHHAAHEIDLTIFPLQALHNLACGICTIIPAQNLSETADFEPALIAIQIEKHGVSKISGTPVFFRRLIDYAVHAQPNFSTVKTVHVSGAPVSKLLSSILVNSFPGAQIDIIHGLTESEPTWTVTAQDIAKAQGHGYLVGNMVSECEAVAVPLEGRAAGANINEILVRGTHLSPRNLYHRDPIHVERDGKTWRKTGDTGYMDSLNRLWLTGPIDALVYTSGRLKSPYLVECDLLLHKHIEHAALINSKENDEVNLVVQMNREGFQSSVKVFCREVLNDAGLEEVAISFHHKIPIGGGYNSKIDRDKVRAWLLTQ